MGGQWFTSPSVRLQMFRPFASRLLTRTQSIVTEHYSGTDGEIRNVCLYKWPFLVASRNSFLAYIRFVEGMSSTGMKERKKNKKRATVVGRCFCCLRCLVEVYLVDLTLRHLFLSEKGDVEEVYKGEVRWRTHSSW